MKNKNCFFWEIYNKDKSKIIAENELFYSRWDDFPVSLGHCEIISKKHIESFFDLKKTNLVELFQIINKTRDIIIDKYQPNAFNIGINEGREAGRTIDHLHIHFIPRYKGDVANPRGGIRNIIPGKGNY